jgi:hypothetical protein
VAFVTTTCKATLDAEVETRILSLSSDGSDDQTRQVVAALLRSRANPRPRPDLEPWHALDRWLRAGPWEVITPWADALATFELAGPPRLRRDISNLMALAEAHALLHRLHREADGAGRIISTTADYGAAVKVLAEAMAIATDKAVPPATRRVVEAVQELHAADAGAQITTRAVARKLGTSPSTTSHDVHDALDRGFLTNVSRAPNKFDLKPADPLPEQGEALPTKEELDAACSGRVRSVFGSQPNTQSRSQSENRVVFGVFGRIRKVRRRRSLIPS